MHLLIPLLVIIYLEPPGPLYESNLKTISRALQDHPGLGGALFCLLVVEIYKLDLQQARENYTIAFSSWVLMASFIGVLFYDTNFDNAHFFYSVTAIVSSFIISIVRWLENMGRNWEFLLLCLSLIFVIISYTVVLSVLGVAEIIYIVLTLSFWLITRQKHFNETFFQ